MQAWVSGDAPGRDHLEFTRLPMPGRLLASPNGKNRWQAAEWLCPLAGRAVSRLVVLTNNLMDSSRVQSAVPDAAVARSLDDDALAAADMILLDLTSGIDPADVVAIGPPVVAYGPHVDSDALDAAVAAGCREALPRSKVFLRLSDLLDRT